MRASTEPTPLTHPPVPRYGCCFRLRCPLQRARVETRATIEVIDHALPQSMSAECAVGNDAERLSTVLRGLLDAPDVTRSPRSRTEPSYVTLKP